VHLGILSQCSRKRVLLGSVARYYLRLAWLFCDQERFYGGSDPEAIAPSLRKCRSRWKKELPQQEDYPVQPGVFLNEIEALRMPRTFFERNYETLKEVGVEDELRLRYLLAEIGFRLYELSDDAADHKKAATFFSGTMQKSLSIISDKTIVGGLVNRAKEMLEVSGERGRELRALHKERGGTDEGSTESKPATKKKAKKKVDAFAKTGAVTSGPGKINGNGKAQPNKTAKTSAEDAPTAVPAEDLGGSERDRFTRQVSVLAEEVGQLKGRLQELEADNKKWRQLIGRDTLTGLPNKISLFRIHLPKVLRELSSSGPFSCIAICLDQIGRVNDDFGWLMGGQNVASLS
jgi:hypothetical protein